MAEADKTRFHFGDAVGAVVKVSQSVADTTTKVTAAADKIKADADSVAQDAETVASNTVLEEISQPSKVSKDAWQNRERMAYISLFSMVGVTVGLFFVNDAKKLEELAVALTWFYGAMGGIVAAFMGFKAYAQVRGK